MTIKITPQFENTGPAERARFEKLIQQIQMLGWTVQLLHYTDGTIRMRALSQKEIAEIQKIEPSYCHD